MNGYGKQVKLLVIHNEIQYGEWKLRYQNNGDNIILKLITWLAILGLEIFPVNKRKRITIESVKTYGVPLGSKVYYQCDTLNNLRATLIILRATLNILRVT